MAYNIEDYAIIGDCETPETAAVVGRRRVDRLVGLA
jgi:hypothetical protein